MPISLDCNSGEYCRVFGDWLTYENGKLRLINGELKPIDYKKEEN